MLLSASLRHTLQMCRSAVVSAGKCQDHGFFALVNIVRLSGDLNFHICLPAQQCY